jgi:hypothetical protein
MLILDKSRALDLMVAYATQVHVPAELSFAWERQEAPAERPPFRVAIYGPLERAEPAPADLAEHAPASRSGWTGLRAPAPASA